MSRKKGGLPVSRQDIICPDGCPLKQAGFPPLVTIPLSDYQKLLSAGQALAERTLSFEQLSKPRRSPIDRNPEIAVFISMRLGTKPVSQIVAECRKEFGASRTPSEQAVYRYWSRLRIAAVLQGKSAAK